MSMADEFLHCVPGPVDVVPAGLQRTDLLSDFPPAIDASHIDVLHGAAPRIIHAVQPMFPNKSEVTTIMPAPLHSPELNVPVNASRLAMLDPSAISAGPPAELIREFMPREPFAMQGLGVSNHIPVKSTSVNMPSSLPPSHLPLPMRQPLTSPYVTAPPSLVSALDGVALTIGSSTPQSVTSNGVASPVSESVLSPICSTSTSESQDPFNVRTGNDLITGKGDTPGDPRAMVQNLFTRCCRTSQVSKKLSQTCFATG